MNPRRALGAFVLIVAGCGSNSVASHSLATNVSTQSAVRDFSFGIVAPDGSMILSSCESNRIYKVSVSDDVAGLAGAGAHGSVGDGGLATEAQLTCPIWMALDSTGNLYFVERGASRVRKIDSDGIVTTAVGTGVSGYSGDGGAATHAQLDFPTYLAVDQSDNLFIADRDNDRVRRVDTGGVITTVAGSGANGFAGDSKQAAKASFDDPEGIAVAADGTTFIADDDNARIRRVDPNGIMTSIAGTGEIGSAGDGGPAAQATLALPNQLLLDQAGNLYITEEDIPRIRRIDANGQITTFAGTDTAGNSGDGGPAGEAQLSGALGVGVDSTGQIYIFDAGSGCVRVVDSKGVITTRWCV